jgi:hypothetical protein
MNLWDTYDRWKLEPPTRVDEDEEAAKVDEWIKQEKEKSDERSSES